MAHLGLGRQAKRAALSVAFVALWLSPASAFAAGAPDLSVSLTGPTAVGTSSPFTVNATVTNHGTAPATGVTVSYVTGTPGPAISPIPTTGFYCTYNQYGHSGRGGGITTVGMACSETIAGGLAPGHSVVVPMAMLETKAQTLNLSFSTYPYPVVPQLNVVSHTATMTVTVVQPAPAAAPTNLTATESGDQLNVSWAPAAATAPYISKSLITAMPIAPSTAPVLTASVTGATTSGFVPGVVASTTYSITVRNDDSGGIGATSQPITFTTVPATIVPGAPVITYTFGYADISWNPPSAGNSAIDEYEVTATGGGNAIDNILPGTATSDYMSPAPADQLTVMVRAHNAAGWGPWSSPVYFYDGGN